MIFNYFYVEKSDRHHHSSIIRTYDSTIRGQNKSIRIDLHKDGAPCFRTDTRILIKNNDDNIQVKYNK